MFWNSDWRNLEPKYLHFLRKGFFEGCLISLAIVLALPPIYSRRLVLNLSSSAADDYLSPANPHRFLTHATGRLTSFVAITVFFGFIFKLMPDVSLE